jgi:hypothetical protein
VITPWLPDVLDEERKLDLERYPERYGHIWPGDYAKAFELAQAIDGSQSLRNCMVCKQWFTISAGQGRSDKEYCSDACRVRAYRKRKGRAARKPTRSKKR